MKIPYLPHRLDVFHLAAKFKSFTQAADTLDISNSMVSQHISKLESQLDAKLLNRTTRVVALTPAGKQLFDATSAIFERLDLAVCEIGKIQNELSGCITINAQTDFGEKSLIPLAIQFMQTHPKVTFDVSLEDEVRDLIKHEIDISFTIGRLRYENYHTVKLGDVEPILCSSASYLKQHGKPENLGDLHQHKHILLGLLVNPGKWTFTGPNNQPETITLEGAITANSSQGLQAFTNAGAGMTVLLDFIIKDQLDSGSLVRVLPEYSLPKQGVFAVYNDRASLPICVRAFIDYVKQAMVV